MVTYCLIIHCNGGKIKIGKLGRITFKRGYYIYVGSGLFRIERHYRKEKKLKWHIDYLLRKARIIGFALSKKKECNVARKFSKKFISIEKFGCSDCKCKSHLFYSSSMKKIKKFVDKL
jgi:Uri superfamily endonuclease